MKDKKSMIITVVVALIVGALCFYEGMIFQKNKSAKSFQRGANFQQMMQQDGNGPMGQQGNNQGRNGPVTGEITAKDDQSITVKTNDGSSKIIIFSTATAVSKSITAKVADLKIGEKITIMGSTTNSGTVTAKSIVIGQSVEQPVQ